MKTMGTCKGMGIDISHFHYWRVNYQGDKPTC
nr:MAG TPA: ribosomal protein L11 [Crassvirales sp.]